MPQITIQGTVIDLADTGDSPDWSQSVIEFAEAVEDALSGVAGSYDVSPQVMNIDAYNIASAGADITNLLFSTTAVRAAIINIATYRNTATTTVSEISVLHIVYNASNSVNQKWEVTREITGDGKITFAVSDTGVVSFVIRASDGALTGASYNGLLSYSAKALLNT